MKVINTDLPGVFIIEPTIYVDDRGFFKESYNYKRFYEFGIEYEFVQDNHSRSQRGVLRGLHYQTSKPQGKLVSCSFGSVYDVAVDINPRSSTFCQYVGIELSGENHKQLFIPPGYAHGFCVLSDVADFQYKCTEIYLPGEQHGIIWNDAEINISWPITNPILSDKDSCLPSLKEIYKKGIL